MEMDIMEQRGPLLTSIVGICMKVSFSIFLITLLVSCTSNKTEMLEFTFQESEFEHINNLLNRNNKPFTGMLVAYFNESLIKSKRPYVQGLLNGQDFFWYPNGQLATSRHYTNGIKTGTHKGWWNDGQLKFIYPINNQGQYEGEVREWYKSGQQYKSFYFEKGKESGSQKLWKSDGRIKANYVIKNGHKYGLIGLKRCYTVRSDSSKMEK
ncbi:MAG: antitoxin component YwqK of YwqJK toxin-antitoxin module [Saprospiraceae bacterium]|jgi:antitoxin component YwqK of YwqJK toxin-antitoxin module